MSLTQPVPLDATTLAAMAEEVRAYVVATRGGAPFLSAADGRLLVGWLESGISVARILAAVDEVAEKRRKKPKRKKKSVAPVEEKTPRSPTSSRKSRRTNVYAVRSYFITFLVQSF